MKNYFIGMLAIVFAISFSAFTPKNAHVVKPLNGEKWFVFNGTSPGDLEDATKYELDGTGSAPTVCPTDESSQYRCEILAPVNGFSQPVIASRIDERKRTNP